MKYMRRTAGYIWTDYKTNVQIAKELKITQILDKLLEYNRNWIQHVNRMPRNRLPRVMKRYSPNGRRNHGRPLKRLLDTWDRNGSTSGPTPWHIYDDDDNQLDAQFFFMSVYFYSLHVSGSHVPIIRRINRINTSGICHSVYMTVWCAGLDETHPNLHTRRSSIQSDIYQMSYWYN